MPERFREPETARPVTRRYRQQLNSAWLQAEYVKAERSVADVAAEAGVSTQTVYRALHRHDIALRPRVRKGVRYSWGDVLTEPFLRDAYGVEGRSVRDIAAEVGCAEATVTARLRRYDIPRRGVQPADRLILADACTPEALRERVEAGATNAEIAADLDVDAGTVAAYLRRYGIRPGG